MATLIPSISACASRQNHGVLPLEIRTQRGSFDPCSNKIRVLLMKVSKGLEFPVVALPWPARVDVQCLDNAYDIPAHHASTDKPLRSPLR